MVFVATVVGIGFTLAFLRLSTGSVWPAIVLHGVWNAVIQGTFDASTKEPSIWVGETGILVAAASLAVAWVLVRKGFDARRAPARSPSRRSRALPVEDRGRGYEDVCQA